MIDDHPGIYSPAGAMGAYVVAAAAAADGVPCPMPPMSQNPFVLSLFGTQGRADRLLEAHRRQHQEKPGTKRLLWASGVRADVSN